MSLFITPHDRFGRDRILYSVDCPDTKRVAKPQDPELTPDWQNLPCGRSSSSRAGAVSEVLQPASLRVGTSTVSLKSVDC